MPVMRMVSNVVTNLLEVTRGLNVPSKGKNAYLFQRDGILPFRRTLIL